MLGLFAAIFMIAASAEDPFWPAMWCGAVFLCLILLFGMSLRVKQDVQSGTLSNWFRAQTPEKPPDYSPRRVRTSAASAEDANTPPTADEVRELKDSSPNTWVPSSVRRDRG